MDVSEVFTGMAYKFQEFGLEDIHGVFQFHVTGPQGGDWFAVCEGDRVRVEKGVHQKPDVTVSGSPDIVVKLAEGRLNPALAMLTRRMKVKGNPVLIAKLGLLLMGKV